MTTVMTVNEVATYLRVHVSTIYRLMKRQRLPTFKIGRERRFNLESIDRWRVQVEGGGGSETEFGKSMSSQ